MDRQTGWLHEMGIFHPQRFGFGVHRADKRVVTTRIMVSKACRRAVLRGHQRQQQHIFTADFTVQTHARVDPFHLWRVADIHLQLFIQRQSCIKHHHRGHDFGYGSDRAHQIRVTGVDHLVGIQVYDHRAAGRNLGLRSSGGDCGRFGDGWRGSGDAQQQRKTKE